MMQLPLHLARARATVKDVEMSRLDTMLLWREGGILDIRNNFLLGKI